MIIVLWSVMTLSFIAGLFADRTGQKALSVERHMNRQKMVLAAQNGLEMALGGFLLPKGISKFSKKRMVMVFDDIKVEIDMVYEDEKINVNLATEQMLYDGFILMGFEDEKSQILAHQVLDWRDGDGSKRPFGADTDTYQALNLPYMPWNMDFTNISLLNLLPAMNDESFSVVRNFVTVYGNSSRLGSSSDITGKKNKKTATQNMSFAPLSLVPLDKNLGYRLLYPPLLEFQSYQKHSLKLLIKASLGTKYLVLHAIVKDGKIIEKHYSSF